MDRYFTEEEQARLLGTLKKVPSADLPARRDAAAIRALLHSGCRIGEFLKITVGDALASLQANYLFIPRENRKGKWTDHQIFVTAPLAEDLRELVRVRAMMVPGDCRTEDPLVLSRLGRGMSVRGFELRFKHWATVAGLPKDASPHWMRHTRAMNIMRRSTSRDPRGVVQRSLGHASITSTGIYTETAREDVEAALAEVDGQAGRVSARKLRQAWEGRVGA